MNLHVARPWEEPHFFTRSIAPMLPFIAAAIVMLAFSISHAAESQRILAQQQALLPTSDIATAQTAYLNAYNRNRTLLADLYAAHNTTLDALNALGKVLEILPPTVRLASVDFTSPATSVTIGAEVPDAQKDVSALLTNVNAHHYTFNLTSLTPGNAHGYELHGTIGIPLASLSTRRPRTDNPPAERKRPSHPQGSHR